MNMVFQPKARRAKSIVDELRLFSDALRACNLQRYFKTGKGEYGEGDVFLGLKVPQVRHVVRKYWKETSLKDAHVLLHSKYHEVRLCALLILVEKFQRADKIDCVILESEAERSDIGNPNKRTGSPSKLGMTPASIRKQIFDLYISNTKYINNWDLVDLSAGYIVGQYSADKPKDLLYKLAKSKNLWERRISIISTLYFIVFEKKPSETIKIAKMLLHDKHDLIHKAVGWMLREVGKRCSEKTLTDFLDQYAHEMPRTMLRYSIERLTEKQRLYYLRKKL